MKMIEIGTGSHLLSRAVSSQVPSAAWVLTIVFGMRTGVTPKRIATGKFRVTQVSVQINLIFLYRLHLHLQHLNSNSTLTSSSLERR